MQKKKKDSSLGTRLHSWIFAKNSSAGLLQPSQMQPSITHYFTVWCRRFALNILSPWLQQANCYSHQCVCTFTCIYIPQIYHFWVLCDLWKVRWCSLPSALKCPLCDILKMYISMRWTRTFSWIRSLSAGNKVSWLLLQFGWRTQEQSCSLDCKYT